MTTPIKISDLGLLFLLLIKEDKLVNYSTLALVHGPGKYPKALVDRICAINDLFFGKRTTDNKMFKVWEAGGPTLVICSSRSEGLRGRTLSTVLMVDVPDPDMEKLVTSLYPAMSVSTGARIYQLSE